jgi:predicted DNA-binding protein
MGMKQTNINLEEWQYQRLKELAAKEKKSLSQLFRELVEERFELEEEELEEDPIFSVVGLGKGDGSNIARQHDKAIYRKADK